VVGDVQLPIHELRHFYRIVMDRERRCDGFKRTAQRYLAGPNPSGGKRVNGGDDVGDAVEKHEKDNFSLFLVEMKNGLIQAACDVVGFLDHKPSRPVSGTPFLSNVFFSIGSSMLGDLEI
jgi:hypothetical protein